MSEYYVYTYRDPITDVPFYVGKGKDDRANTHLECSTNRHVRAHIARMSEKPLIEIQHCANEFAAFWMERMLIAAYGREDNGTGCLFNHTDGGEGGSGFWSEESREKLRRYRLGRKESEQTRNRQSEAHRGVPLSAAHRKAMSIAQRKRFASKGIQR